MQFDGISLIKRYKNLLIIGAVLIAVGLIASQAYNYWRAQNYAVLIVNGSPVDLTMQLGDKKYKKPSKIYVSPGEYTLGFSRDNFSSTSRKVTLEKQKTTTVNVPLYATNEEGEKYFKIPANQTQAEFVGGLWEDETSTKFTNDFPIVRSLPITRRDFIIDYSSRGELENRTIYIRITHAGTLGKKNAEDWIRQKGYDPATFDISYIDISKIPIGTDEGSGH